jgi:LysR family transcriptional regulator, transcription activator of glutamate synthase operon
MDTDALRWFQLVADGVTVTEVSEIEGVSQPGVSRALARLEKDVGTPLLRRSGRTLRMTRAGSAFKRHVDAMLHQLDDGLAAVEQTVDPETGTVQLAYQVSLGVWLVPDLLASFRLQHPRVRFELRQVRDERVDSVLDTGRADLVLSTVRPADDAVKRERLLDEPLRLAVPTRHRLAGLRHIRLAEAADEQFLMLRPSSALRRLCDQLCREAGFEPAVALEGDDVLTLQGFVAAGLGVAIVPALGLGPTAQQSESVHYLQLTDDHATREISVFWPEDRRLLPAAELFRSHVVDRARTGRLGDRRASS